MSSTLFVSYKGTSLTVRDTLKDSVSCIKLSGRVVYADIIQTHQPDNAFFIFAVTVSLDGKSSGKNIHKSINKKNNINDNSHTLHIIDWPKSNHSFLLVPYAFNELPCTPKLLPNGNILEFAPSLSCAILYNVQKGCIVYELANPKNFSYSFSSSKIDDNDNLLLGLISGIDDTRKNLKNFPAVIVINANNGKEIYLTSVGKHTSIGNRNIENGLQDSLTIGLNDIEKIYLYCQNDNSVILAAVGSELDASSGVYISILGKTGIEYQLLQDKLNYDNAPTSIEFFKKNEKNNNLLTSLPGIIIGTRLGDIYVFESCLSGMDPILHTKIPSELFFTIPEDLFEKLDGSGTDKIQMGSDLYSSTGVFSTDFVFNTQKDKGNCLLNLQDPKGITPISFITSNTTENSICISAFAFTNVAENTEPNAANANTVTKENSNTNKNKNKNYSNLVWCIIIISTNKVNGKKESNENGKNNNYDILKDLPYSIQFFSLDKNYKLLYSTLPKFDRERLLLPLNYEFTNNYENKKIKQKNKNSINTIFVIHPIQKIFQSLLQPDENISNICSFVGWTRNGCVIYQSGDIVEMVPV